MYVKKEGTYKKVNNLFIKLNGAYNKVKKCYVKVDGVYRAVSLTTQGASYKEDYISILVQAGVYINYPLEVYNSATPVVWNYTVTTGDFEVVDIGNNQAELRTKNVSSTGVLWAEVEGVSLGDVPVTIKYSGGL